MTVSAAIPAGAGVGLKARHCDAILETMPAIGWFEVHAENYMGAGGMPHRQLESIRADYPVSLHGVGLSIGADRPLDEDHLARLKALDRRYQPGLFSEHLAWSTHDDVYFNDLLPVPYTTEALARVCDHIDRVQEVMGRRMLLENPSTYLIFETSTMSEIEFLEQIVARTGCGLLLDVNNVFVSATNQGYSPDAYLEVFPVAHVEEIHLGGHAEDTDDTGARLLIDAHDRAVADPVWALYGSALERTGAVPTLIEWDNDVPAWETLLDQACTADRVMAKAERPAA